MSVVTGRNRNGKVWKTTVRAWSESAVESGRDWDEMVSIERRSDDPENRVRIKSMGENVYVELDNLRAAIVALEDVIR